MNREKQEYLARAFGCGIHEGDTVRLVRAWTEEEGEHTVCWWEEELEHYIGEAGTVLEIMDDGDFAVIFETMGDRVWYFPYFVLEKVENR